MFDPEKMSEAKASAGRQMKWIRRGALLLLIPAAYYSGKEVGAFTSCASYIHGSQSNAD